MINYQIFIDREPEIPLFLDHNFSDTCNIENFEPV